MSLFKPRYGSTPTISDREFLERIINERDRFYTERFRSAELAAIATFTAQKESIADALTAQKEATASAFLASENAIDKAEEAQRAYNVVHNDLARKMDEQYKEMMPRPETLGLFKGIDDKLTTIQKGYEDRLADLRMSVEKTTDEIEEELARMREAYSGASGARNGARELMAYLIAAGSIIAAVIIYFVR